MTKFKINWVIPLLAVALLAFAGTGLFIWGNFYTASAEEVPFSEAAAIVAAVENDGEEQPFTVTVTDKNDDSNVWTAAGTGAVLLTAGKTAPITWVEQSIPAGFSGEVYVPLYHTAPSWDYTFLNSVFAGGKIWPTEAEVEFDSEIFKEIRLIDAEEAAQYEAMTTITEEMAADGGAFAEIITEFNKSTPDTMAYVQTAGDYANMQVKGVSASAADTYGMALRIKNLSGKAFPLQMTLGSPNNSWTATRSKEQYDSEKFYMLYVGKDGTMQKVYTFIGSTDENAGLYNQYFSIPAEADGTLIIPWHEIMYAGKDLGDFCGVMFDPDRITFNFNKQNIAQGLAIGDIGYLSAQNIVKAVNMKEHNDISFSNSSLTPITSAVLTVTAKGETQSSWFTVEVNGKNVESGATVYTGERINFVPSTNFQIAGVEINGASLEMENGKFTYIVPSDTNELTIAVEADVLAPKGKAFVLDESYVQEGRIPVSSLQAVAVEVDNTNGNDLTFELTVIDAETMDYWITTGEGTIALMETDGDTYYAESVIPAGFSGYAIIRLSGVAQSYSANTYVNPSFASPSTEMFPEFLDKNVYCRLFDGNAEITDGNILKSVEGVAVWETARDAAVQTIKTRLETDEDLRKTLDGMNEQDKQDMGVLSFTAVDPTSSLGYFKVDLKSYLAEEVYSAQKTPIALVMRAEVMGGNDWFNLQPRVTDTSGTMYSMRGNLSGWFMYQKDGTVSGIELSSNSQYITIKGNGVLVLPMATLSNYVSGNGVKGMWNEVCAFESWLFNKDMYNQQTLLALGEWGILLEDGSVQKLFDFGDLESDVMKNVEIKNSLRITPVGSTIISLLVNGTESDATASLSVAGTTVYLGDVIQIVPADGYKVTYVTVNGTFLESSEEGYFVSVTDTSAPITIEAETEKIDSQSEGGGEELPNEPSDKPGEEDEPTGGCSSSVEVVAFVGIIAALGILVCTVILIHKKRKE